MIRAGLFVALTLAAAAEAVAAQHLACSTIRPGETAAGAAMRVTGDAANWRQPWFQIVDPDIGSAVAKADYDRIYAGWRACVVQQPVGSRSRAETILAASIAALHAFLDPVVRAFRGLNIGLLWAGLVLSAAFLWMLFDDYFAERRQTIDAMTRFGERFVREFERPLRQSPADARAIRSRLRARPDSRRLEILLAPGEGRRYPNLSDHRHNVSYDVARILQLLRDQSFVSGPLFAEGPWVVVPFQFQHPPQQAGGS